ncbi:MAG: hypothetical protein ACI9Y1_002763 [Lentisphaeria bacterium]|jgi:hypothetical protein
MLSLPRFIYALAFASALLMAGTPVAVLIGGIVGESLSGNPNLATLPLAIMVCSVAFSAIPAARILNTYGYKILFSVATALSLCANAAAFFALQFESFSLWLLCMVLTGASAAGIQQMRFCVSKFVGQQNISVALSVFMLSGVVAAVVGPEIAARSHFSEWPEFSDAYIVLSVLQLFTLGFLFSLSPPAPHATDAAATVHTLRSSGVLAILASVTAYGIMAFVMTATPISMHSHHGHSLLATKSVIQWHILAMFLPSFFSGKLIQSIGTHKSIVLGLGCFACAFILTLQGLEFINFAGGLILIGLGWNILFTTGSTLAAQHHNIKFRGKHDAWVFGIQALASLGAGAALFSLGWAAIQWLAILASLPLIFCIIASSRR